MYCMKCQPSIIRFIINNNKALFQKIDMSEYVSEIDELSFLHNTSMNKITKERKIKKNKVYIISYTKSLYQIYFLFFSHVAFKMSLLTQFFNR